MSIILKVKLSVSAAGMICVALLFTVASSVAQLPGGPPGGAVPSMPVILAPVQQQELREQLWFSGSVISRNHADIAAENAGRIIAVPEVGDYFKRGEVIVRLDDALLQQELIAQKAESVSLQASIGFLNREVGRLNELAKNNNAALSRLEQMQADLDATRAMYAANQARVARTDELLRRMSIVAPFDGVINERHAEEGEWVSAGDEIVALTDPQSLEITTSVPAYILSQVAVGDLLIIEVNGQAQQANLRTVVPVADSVSRLFELRLDWIIPTGYARQLVRVAVPISSPRNSLVVPEDALVIRNTGMSVMRVTRDQMAQRVPVQVGVSTSDGLIEVRNSTLKIGDQVIIRGAERVREGMSVRPLHAPQGDSQPSLKSRQ